MNEPLFQQLVNKFEYIRLFFRGKDDIRLIAVEQEITNLIRQIQIRYRIYQSKIENPENDPEKELKDFLKEVF